MFTTNNESPIFLAFFDVLGTSKLIEAGKTEKVLEFYEFLSKLMEKNHGRDRKSVV